MLFRYVYPGERDVVPAWVMRRLLSALEADPPHIRLCRGPLLSRAQYLTDVREWGYLDARRPPFGRLTSRDHAIWTNAISAHWSRRRAATA